MKDLLLKGDSSSVTLVKSFLLDTLDLADKKARKSVILVRKLFSKY